jgi:hypothetical protein
MRETMEKPENLPANGGIRPGGAQQRMVRHRWESVTELRQSKPKDAISYARNLVNRDPSNWLGAPDVKSVYRILDSGWPEGLRRVREALGKLAVPPLPSVRRAKARADFGDEVDMQRVWSGDLNRAWATTRRKFDPRRKAAQTVTILCRLGGNCHLRADRLFWQGACAVALIDALKRSNRSVKLVAFMHSRAVDAATQTTEHLLELPILEAGQQADLEKLAAVLCLAGFFRTEGFKSICQTCAHVTPFLGYTTEGIPAILKTGQKVIEVSSVYDEASAKAFLEKVVQGL